MSRKIIFIIIGALLFLALLILLWFWFLHRSPDAGPQGSGFGTSTDRTTGLGGGAGGGNTPGSVTGGGGSTTPGGGAYLVSSAGGAYMITPSGPNGQNLSPGTYRVSSNGAVVGTYGLNLNNLGQYTLVPQGITGGPLPPGSYTFTPIPLGGGLGGTTTIPIITTGSTTNPTTGTSTTTNNTGSSTPPIGGIPSDTWISSSLSERVFSPSDIASLDNPGALGGTPLISRTPQPAGLGTSGLIIGATAAACLAQWIANQVTGAAVLADPVIVVEKPTSVPVLDFSAAKQRTSQSVLQCIVKSIAQAAIDQITRSVVNWINSGFNGSPSFVTNFNQFFANVADQAAGEFIKGSALSFLCSPFSAQIKIAIAQSYANRSNTGNSCTLSKITNNINGFINGKWGSGGWGSFLQFTTIPANNAYGSYVQGRLDMQGAIASAQNNANRNVSPGGFISVQKCDASKGQTAGKGNCKVSTPGQVIQDSLNQSLGSSIGQLQVAQNIDEIIRALINQLMLKTLYGGLANANNGITNPLAPAIDQAASAQAQVMLTNLQTAATYAVQFGSVKQGSASDVQQMQTNYNSLYNCWIAAASSTKLSLAQQSQASQSAVAVDAQIAQLETRVTAYNNEVTRANAALAVIQNLQSQMLFASTPDDVTAATYAITAAQGQLIQQAEVTTAQQDRASLQAELTTLNQQATATYNQCKALGA